MAWREFLYVLSDLAVEEAKAVGAREAEEGAGAGHPRGGWRFDLLEELGIHQSGGVTDEHFMEEALRQARKAAAKGEVPVGAVLVVNGVVLTKAHNQVEELKDATAHAEMLVVTAAAGEIGDWRLNEATVYVTKEPCPMCAGAIVLSRVKRVVYGVSDPKGGAAGGALVGVAVGAIAGDAGKGAAIGATSLGLTGGMRSRRAVKAAGNTSSTAVAAYQQQFGVWTRNYMAAMEAKGYSLR